MHKINKHLARVMLLVFILVNVFLQQGLEIFAATDKASSNGSMKQKAIEAKEPQLSSDPYGKIDFGTEKPGKQHKGRTEKEIIVKYGKIKDNEKSSKLSDIKKKLNMKKLYRKNSFSKGFEIIEIDESDDIDEAMNEIRNTSGVLYAQPNYQVEILSSPADEYFNLQWGLENSGQQAEGIAGKAGADINVLEAWKTTKGSDSVVVGILDTGLDTRHTDIKDNIFVNTGEIPENGIDDDSNGYVDDVTGWDFVENDNKVEDDSEHATMIAGIIAAKEDKSGVVGVAPGIKVLPLKVFDGRYAYTSDILDAIKYAKDLGVDILNCSWGSSTYNQALRDAMEESDLCFVCAAGNDGTEEVVYPAGFRLSNVISVGAAGNSGERAEFSNYGDFVDVAAPGVDIFSTRQDNSYGYASGTSYAAAFVSGIAALLKSSREGLTGKDLACTIKANTQEGPVTSPGLVDAANALVNIKTYDEENNSDPSVIEEVYGAPSVTEDVYGVFETLSAAKLEDFLVEQIHYGQKGVSPATGNFSRSYVDAQIKAPGFDFVISRTYNSKDDKDCLHLGRGWRFGYEGFVDGLSSSKRVTVTLPDGSRHTFLKYNNTYVQDLSCGSRSHLIYDGSYKLTDKDQTVYEFGVSGGGKKCLTSITDKYGNKTVINVDEKGKIQGIVLKNANGGTIRSFGITYGTNEFISKVTETTDGSTRVLVQYGYDGKNLTTVTDAMNNAVYTYEYSGSMLSTVKDAYLKVIEEITYKYYQEYKNYKVETHKVYATDTASNTYSYDYDPLNRITTITDSEGKKVTKWFDKNLFTIKSKDPEGKETKVEYNTNEGRMIFNLLANPGHAKSHPAEVVYNGRIYYLGGLISSYYRSTVYDLSTNQCEYFDSRTNKWQNTASMPKDSENSGSKAEGRKGAAAAVSGSDIYVAGGCIYHANTEPMIDKKLKSVLKYNPSSNTWDTVPSMNNARSDFSLVELAGYLYAIGGDGAPTSVEKYDPAQKKWTAVDSTRYACMSNYTNGYSNFAAVLDGKIYVIDTSFNLEVYDPLTNKWSILSSNAPVGGLVVNEGVLYCINPSSGLCAKYDFNKKEWKLVNTLMSINSNNYSVVECQGRIYTIENNIGLFDQMSNMVFEVTLDNTFEYNRYGEEKRVTDRDGNVYVYDRDGRGNITRITNPDLTTREYAYDSRNNLISERDEESKYTFYIYDSTGVYLRKVVKPLTQETTKYVEGENDAKFAITKYEYYSPEACYYLCGMLWKEIDPEGYQTIYTYDSKGNVLTVGKTRIGSTSQIKTTYQYNSFGWKTSEVTQKGFKTEYAYDNNGRLVKVKLHGGETSRIVYDKMGRVIKEISASLYSAEDDGLSKTPRTFEYSKDHGIRTSYYVNGLVQSKTDAQNNTTTYKYDKYGNLTEEVRPDGSVYRYYYDVMNRLVRLCFKESTAVPDSSALLLEKYDYTTIDNGFTQKTSTKYLNSTETAITVQTYDQRKRLIKQLDPDNTSTVTTYYGNGSIKTLTDKNGSKTHYKYDSCGHLTEVWTPLDYTGNANTYSYNRIEYYHNGLVASDKRSIGHTNLNIVPSAFITKEYKYHINGKVEEEKLNGRVTAKYQYDADGYLSSEMKYTSDTAFVKTEYVNNYFGKPDNKALYARKGDIYGNTYTDNTELKITTGYKYNKNGDLSEITSPGQKVTTYLYDNNNKLTSTAYTDVYVNDQGTETTGENKTSKTYTWDGKVKTETDANGNLTEYIYNKRGFLEKIKNRVKVNGVQTDIYTAYYYDRAGRKTAEVSPQNYTEGYTLSQMNRTEYIYDAMGRVKASKQVYYDTTQGKWVEYISKAYKYDAQGNVIKELDALGYEAGSGTTIDQKIETGYGTEYTYTLANQVKTMTDSVSKERFLPFSVMYLYNGLGRKTSEINIKGAYTNYYYDDFGNVEYIKIKESSSAAEKTIKHNKYDYTGNLISTADGKGYEITHRYNALAKVRETVFSADDGIRENTIEYQYDADGNLKRQADTFGTVDISPTTSPESS